MSTTTFTHRLLVAIPAARRAAMVAWWDGFESGAGAATWSVGLNATGLPADPVQAWWISIALTDSQLQTVLVRLAALTNAVTPGSITVPADWATRTRAQKAAWIGNALNVGDPAQVVRAKTGIYIARADGEGVWDDPETILAALGLKRIQATP